jgi:hypothetical protein
MGAVLVQPPALSTMAAVVLVFALPKRLRHHLHGSGFVVIAAAWMVAVLAWIIWQGGNGWPVFASGRWLPEWRLIPNLLRWIVLASPLLLGLFVVAVRSGFAQATLMSHRSLPLAMLLPLAGIDFLFGPHEHWPDMDGAVWMLFAAMLLAHRGMVTDRIAVEEKISLRTIAIVLAALQSAFLLQTDLPRTLGCPGASRGSPRPPRITCTSSPRIPPNPCAAGERARNSFLPCSKRRMPGNPGSSLPATGPSRSNSTTISVRPSP